MQNLRDILKTQLHTALHKTSLSCTTDVWTDKIRHVSFLGVTAHFADIDENGNIRLNSKMLGLDPFDPEDAKNGKTINKLLKNILEQYDLVDHMNEITFVTDRGGSMITSLKDYKRNSCLAHLINNITHASIKEAIKTVTRVSRIVKYLKVTGLNSLLSKRIISYIVTRWNSVFDMLDTFLECWNEIENILTKKDNEFIQLFRKLSKTKMEAIRDYLRTYKLLTSEIEGDREVTSVKICSVVEFLLVHNQPRENDISVIRSMKRVALKYIQDNKSAHPDDYETFAFFNPLYKKFEGFSHINKQNAIEKIRKILNVTVCEVVENHPPNQPEKSLENNFSLLDIFNDGSSQDPSIGNVDVEYEIQKYLNHNITGMGQLDILVWWKDHKFLYPRLYNYFLKIAGIPASSAPSERLFSCAGNFLTVKRNRLRHDSLKDLLFMYIN